MATIESQPSREMSVPKSTCRILGRENLIGSASDIHPFWDQSAFSWRRQNYIIQTWLPWGLETPSFAGRSVWLWSFLTHIIWWQLILGTLIATGRSLRVPLQLRPMIIARRREIRSRVGSASVLSYQWSSCFEVHHHCPFNLVLYSSIGSTQTDVRLHTHTHTHTLTLEYVYSFCSEETTCLLGTQLLLSAAMATIPLTLCQCKVNKTIFQAIVFTASLW